MNEAGSMDGQRRQNESKRKRKQSVQAVSPEHKYFVSMLICVQTTLSKAGFEGWIHVEKAAAHIYLGADLWPISTAFFTPPSHV